ncbi:alpha/beta hydrolase [Neobacillus sp. MER 74]|uniref:alpha/beta fold hydrolase n=1 Tax=Bacillaceae TaxID=186817 RepID=UPI000BF38204|nr:MULTISPECIES: alpha/beta hydrolase [Bacillaceae]MCM3115605.1 alpha/beta hydrolase [Neobacillus sp. MER 74]PFP31193.1 alpha/beta hydrolase [Bacillus sp. AFS073361]
MGLFSKREFTIADEGIDLVDKINLGGVEHSVLIQGNDGTKPLLLFLHGGPCMPVPGVVSRGQDYAVSISTKELVKHFVVVFWDQRGAGKTYHKNTPKESFRVEQYIQDCHDLIDILRSRFKKEKVYLAGHSWGTIIGLSIASRYPEKLHAYFGISQIINWQDNDQICFDWLKARAEKAKDWKTLKKLEELGRPPYLLLKQWTDFRRPLIKYNSMVYESKTVKHPGILGSLKLFLNSSEYSMKDIFHTLYSSYKLTYTQALVEDFAHVDFKRTKRIEVPLAFLHGAKDIHVYGRPVEQFFQELDAPLGKELVWYENSGHMFHPDDTKKIEKFVIKYANKLSELMVV